VTDLRTSPVSAAAQQDLDLVVDRFLAGLAATEAAARAAAPKVDRLHAWAPWSMDTGLTRAQEDFVDAWSPQRILEHCRGQRELALLLQRWARSHGADADLALTILELAAT
jgi:hypothetical protein